MIKPLLSFFIAIALFENAYGDIRPQGISGSADKRTVIGWLRDRPDYVPPSTKNMWNTSPYNSIVHISNHLASGTGEFISPKHILTNAHVSADCGMSNFQNCQIDTSDGRTLSAHVVFYGATGLYNTELWRTNIGNDWQILEVVDNYCRQEYRDLDLEKTATTTSGLWRAGFGGLRVLYKSDIDAIRKAYDAYLRAGGINSGRGIVIDTKDPNFNVDYKVFLDEFARITGKDFMRDYQRDGGTLKLIQNCGFYGVDSGVPGGNVVFHDCDAWPGDSGSTIKRMSSNRIAGLENETWMYVTTYDDVQYTDGALLVDRFIYNPNIQSALKRAEQECKDWKPDDPEPIKPQPIKPEPDKCKLP